jgi:hypothetical protein
VDGLLVTWVRFPPLAKLPLHTHERATVAVILNGSFDGLMRHTGINVYHRAARRTARQPVRTGRRGRVDRSAGPRPA